jgi:hypothetical protein
LPWSTWAMMATLRMRLGGKVDMGEIAKGQMAKGPDSERCEGR